MNKYLTKKEPPLLKYEEKFCNIANLKYDIFEIRNYIFKTVLEAEKSINDKTNDFIIPPNDMAHLISDLFNSDIDVLFDITSCVLRRKKEEVYVRLIKKLSLSIVDSYFNKRNIQQDVIKIILSFMGEAANDKVYYIDLVKLYENNKTEFYNELKNVLNKIIFEFNKTKLSDENYIRIFNYIYSFRK